MNRAAILPTGALFCRVEIGLSLLLPVVRSSLVFSCVAWAW